MASIRRAFPVLATVIVLLAAEASTASAVTTRGYTGAAFYVVARQKNDDSKIRIAASMHELTAGQEYALVGSRRRCSNVDQPGGRVFRADFAPDAGEDDIFMTGRVAAHLPLRRMRSVVYYDVDALEPGNELGCAKRSRPPRNGTLARSCGKLGELLGCVAARQADGSNTIGVVGSIHGLTPSESYTLVGSTKPCAEAHTNEAQVFRVNLRTDADSDDLFGSRSVNADLPLSQIRSVRLFAQPRRQQRFCDEVKLGE
jgi:hypothetical protein